MATSNPQATGDFVQQALVARADELPQWKKYKGTAIAAAGAIATVAAVLIGAGLEMPVWAMTALVVIVRVADVVGIRYYKPEPTRRQREMVQDAVAHRIDTAHGISERPE